MEHTLPLVGSGVRRGKHTRAEEQALNRGYTVGYNLQYVRSSVRTVGYARMLGTDPERSKAQEELTYAEARSRTLVGGEGRGRLLV